MRAQVHDLPRMLAMCAAMHAESRYRVFDYDAGKMDRLLTSLLENPLGIVRIRPHGLLVGSVNEYWFGRDRYAFDFLLYVEPAFRGGRDAISLIKEYITEARALGAKDIHLENTTQIASDRTERLFEKLGFSRIGGNFVMEA